MSVGSGRNHENGQYELCGQTFTSPSTGMMCVGTDKHNNTVCTSTTMKSTVCASPLHSPQLLAKIDIQGTGWGRGIKYIIKEIGKKEKAFGGTLLDGQYGMDTLCLKKDTCYTYSVSDGPYVESVVWIMCG